MPKAVLTTKVDPSYDDLPEERYHFPRRYLNAARAALGDEGGGFAHLTTRSQ